ncbi:hypothetical protein CABS01_00473 [Colletotrichum abscissum]|uniref:uncharacterized protein n=1 Tax=Colletotrichum abscissum TaxID=1671311 RepID=UPI0027D6FE4A|nr:uncharacterized protein CABS01_00473 [Colletotrichum abscissum]KAK1525384.1 hypothetical protein CABS01_00473 [Colletotrichum abscissum]
MPVVGTEAKARCEAPGCNRTYANHSNLNRHIKANHSQAVEMSCGKSFPNHPWNIKRHKDSCGCVVLVPPTFEVAHMMLDNPNMVCYPANHDLYGSY